MVHLSLKYTKLTLKVAKQWPLDKRKEVL